MIRLTLKSLLSHKLRLLTTSLAVLIGVTFVVGSLGLGATLSKVFDDVFAGAYQKVDTVVRGQEKDTPALSGDITQPVPASVVDEVRAVDGVAEAAGSTMFTAQVIDQDGNPIGGQGPPATGTNWIGGEYDAFQISVGRAPEAPNEVVLDAATAESAQAAVGDTVQVLAGGLPFEAQVVGVAKFGDLDSAGGINYIFFTLDRAFDLVGAEQYYEIVAAAEDGVSQQQLTDRVAAAVGGDYVVRTAEVTSDEDAAALQQGLSFISIIPLVFGIISLAVSAFIINNTFAILLTQRARESALLRAIGARSSQVLFSVVFESFIVGLISSLVGLLLGSLMGYGLVQLIQVFLDEFPTTGLVITPTMIVTGLLAGIGITMAAAFFPAIKASRTPPLAALRDVTSDRSSTSIVRIVLGLVLLVGGLAAIGFGLFAEAEDATYPILGGIGATLLAVYILGPVYVKPLVAVIGLPIARFRGIAGSLSRQNAMRNPRRTAATAAALMIGVTLVSFALVFVASISATTDRLISSSVGGDLIVTAGGGVMLTDLDPELVQQINALPEVDESLALGIIGVNMNGAGAIGSTADPSTLENLFEVPFVEGDFDAVNETTIAIGQDLADAQGWTVGQSVEVAFDNGASAQVTVGSIFETSQLLAQFVIDERTTADALGSAPINQMYVAKTEQASLQDAQTAVEGLTDPYVNVVVQNQGEFRDTLQSQVNIVLYLILALLALAIIIALFGIANTMSLSILERTREIGLLRAIGMTRKQTRTMIRWEAATLALVGTVIGVLLGAAFGAGAIYALRDYGIDVISIPWGSLAIVGILAILAGFLTAVLPARRAARIDVLKAISAE